MAAGDKTVTQQDRHCKGKTKKGEPCRNLAVSGAKYCYVHLRKNISIALTLIATVICTVGPLGYSMLQDHPCEAWTWWTVALVCGSYSLWQLMHVPRWIRLAIIVLAVGFFGFCARRSIYSETELSFFFVHPGVYSPAIGTNGPPGWILLVNGQNTHEPIFNSDMMMRDMEMVRAAQKEGTSNPDEAANLVTKSWLHRSYPEIDPTSSADKIVWVPLNVNAQEYQFDFTYRVGESSFQGSEEIRIVNVGTPITFANRLAKTTPNWQESVTVKNQVGEVFMHCVDARFPRDDRWIAGHPCYPGANFAPLPRSLCARCFARGFEWHRH